ncbi:MAG: hypothetical protein FWF57_09970 [Defluviitaleaceae bacterium]|nr:hypothetical protein [Defluviitaleaceae bacterium]
MIPIQLFFVSFAKTILFVSCILLIIDIAIFFLGSEEIQLEVSPISLNSILLRMSFFGYYFHLYL